MIDSGNTRSSATHLVGLIRTKTYGERRLAWAAASLWNDLPNDIKASKSLTVFKKRLKTHFYRLAFLFLPLVYLMDFRLYQGTACSFYF